MNLSDRFKKNLEILKLNPSPNPKVISGDIDEICVSKLGNFKYIIFESALIENEKGEHKTIKDLLINFPLHENEEINLSSASIDYDIIIETVNDEKLNKQFILANNLDGLSHIKKIFDLPECVRNFDALTQISIKDLVFSQSILDLKITKFNHIKWAHMKTVTVKRDNKSSLFHDLVMWFKEYNDEPVTTEININIAELINKEIKENPFILLGPKEEMDRLIQLFG